MSAVPSLRIRSTNDAPISGSGEYVLYWMTAFRRTQDNFALDRAIEHARALRSPLVVLEPVRAGYAWASPRFHRLVIEGMQDNLHAFQGTAVHYYPYVEPQVGEGSGLLESLARRASVVVTDDWPCFFHPHMISAAAERLVVRLEAVDSCGLLPLAAAHRLFPMAHGFRRFLLQNLEPHLAHRPRRSPLSRLKLPAAPRLEAIERRWPPAQLDDPAELVASLPIDRRVGPVPSVRGGGRSAQRALTSFVRQRLERYAQDRNHPDRDATSGLSPWLHFGHLSPHRVLAELEAAEPHPERLFSPAGEQAWGLGASASAFFDQLVTWRELGFNFCSRRRDYDRYASLPDWAKETLAAHASDRRPQLYRLEQLEAAETHDPVWNAAQRQLLFEGRIHNYLRMLWGKKEILQWTRSPEEALSVMIALNDRWALDGRDPNSYAGIFWVLGRYDRPWPERAIFGQVRAMTSESARRKLSMKEYLRRWAQ